MEEITKAVDLAAREVFFESGYVEINIEQTHIYMVPTHLGFEAIGTTQIQTDIVDGNFWTTVLLERRFDKIEAPLKEMFQDYNMRQPTFATTLWFSYDYFLNEKKESKFEISENGLSNFQEMLYAGLSKIKLVADQYDDIFVLDELINCEFKMNEVAKQILIENIPRIIKRLVIAKLAGNNKWKIYYEKSLAEYEDSLSTVPTEGFRNIVQKRIDSLHKVYQLIPEIKSLKPT